MANKFLDENGLLYFWQKIINKFVAKETDKGLSSNDYTTAEKTKLSGIAEGANKTTVTDSLTSTSKTDALSANQGKVLDEKISAINTTIQGAGKGDMQSAEWDTNNNGQVDKADDADKLGGELPSAYVKQTDLETLAPNEHKHEQGDINGLDEFMGDVTEIANGKCHAEIFDTVEAMNNWLSNSDNTANLKKGDVFLIKAVDVSDYWWDGSSAQVLETTKVELDVITNAEIDTIVATS